jgi:hypothetical protein
MEIVLESEGDRIPFEHLREPFFNLNHDDYTSYKINNKGKMEVLYILLSG